MCFLNILLLWLLYQGLVFFWLLYLRSLHLLGNLSHFFFNSDRFFNSFVLDLFLLHFFHRYFLFRLPAFNLVILDLLMLFNFLLFLNLLRLLDN